MHFDWKNTKPFGDLPHLKQQLIFHYWNGPCWVLTTFFFDGWSWLICTVVGFPFFCGRRVQQQSSLEYQHRIAWKYAFYERNGWQLVSPPCEDQLFGPPWIGIFLSCSFQEGTSCTRLDLASSVCSNKMGTPVDSFQTSCGFWTLCKTLLDTFRSLWHKRYFGKPFNDDFLGHCESSSLVQQATQALLPHLYLAEAARRPSEAFDSRLSPGSEVTKATKLFAAARLGSESPNSPISKKASSSSSYLCRVLPCSWISDLRFAERTFLDFSKSWSFRMLTEEPFSLKYLWILFWKPEMESGSYSCPFLLRIFIKNLHKRWSNSAADRFSTFTFFANFFHITGNGVHVRRGFL